MTSDLQALKSVVPFRELVRETHSVDRSRKVLCPVHDDHKPSCHVYADGFKCFSCGAHGDAVDWLELVHGLSTAEAIRELERRAGGYVPPVAERGPVLPARTVTFRPVSPDVLEQHRRQAEQFCRVPSAVEGRGFTLDDLRRLGFAAYGDDAVFPVTGPGGTVLALKRRYARPYKGQRYRYTTPGRGAVAWCSPGFLERDAVLVIEGELNGMAAWLAAPELAVMGIAGTNGSMHLQVLKGRTVYIYADGDDPGQKARDRWTPQALKAGAIKVLTVDPWRMDACDLAGRYGRAALREELT